jgi:hypothetical protein
MQDDLLKEILSKLSTIERNQQQLSQRMDEMPSNFKVYQGYPF